MHYAAQNGNQLIVALLLENERVNINARAANGMRPIHLAAEKGNIDAIKLIIAKNPFFETEGSSSPLALAEASGKPPAAREIKRYLRSGKMPKEEPGFSSKGCQTRDIGVQVPEPEDGVVARGITADDLLPGTTNDQKKHKHKHQRVIQPRKKPTKSKKTEKKDEPIRAKENSTAKHEEEESYTSTTYSTIATGEDEDDRPEGYKTGDVFTYYTYSESENEKEDEKTKTKTKTRTLTKTGDKQSTKSGKSASQSSTSFVSKHSTSEGSYISTTKTKTKNAEEEEKKESIDDSNIVRPHVALKLRFNPSDYVIGKDPKPDDVGQEKQSVEMKLGKKEEAPVVVERSLTNPIIEAVQANDPMQVQEAVTNNKQLINNCDDDGLTALHYAVLINSLSTVELLCRHGAMLDAQNQNGQTPAHLAALQGYSNIYYGLVKLRANINIKDKHGRSADYYFTNRKIAFDDFAGGCLHGKFVFVEKSLKMYPSFLNERDKGSFTGLMRAVEGNHIDIVNFLISSGADTNLRNSKGKTALFLACERQLSDIAEILLKSAADPNIPDNEGQTVIFLVIKNREAKLLKLLINAKAEVNGKDAEGFTVLQRAAMNKDYDLVQLLLDAGAPPTVQAKNGDTVLHILSNDYNDVTKRFIKQIIIDGASCDEQDHNGQTLLHIACIHEYRDLITFLIAREVKLNIRDKKHNTPLFYAEQGSDGAIVKFLKEKGAAL